MARYVDGFVIPVKKSKVKEYMKIAKKAGEVWMDHGALEYVEAVGNDLNIKMCLPFTKMAKTKPGETVMFSFIVYKSRAHRDAVNKKVMKDKRMAAFMSGDFEMPFDHKKMAYGGFETGVDLSAKKKRGKK